MKDEMHKESAISLFSKGFFSVMSYPFMFDCPRIEKRERRSRRLTARMAREGIGRHFARVGGLISKAYEREMGNAGIKK